MTTDAPPLDRLVHIREEVILFLTNMETAASLGLCCFRDEHRLGCGAPQTS